MTQCPKCQSALKEDYGMVTCPSCGAILFVDMDGIAHMGQEEESSPASHDPSPIESPVDSSVDPAADPSAESPFQFETPAFDPIAFDAPAVDATADATVDAAVSAQPPSDFASIETFQPTVEEPHAADPVTEPLASESDFSMDSFLGFGDPPGADAGGDSLGSNMVGAGSHESPSPDDPLGLNEFANSEMSQAKDGFLMFRVHIAGIDSKEIRESIREAIVDQRFAWDAARIMSTISKGVLKIDRLSPIKATILVSRIKRLPVQIRWEQYAITQAEAEATAESVDERGGSGHDAGYGSDSGESY